MKITDITVEKKADNKQRLAAYCRVSSDSEDQLHSFAAQVCYYTNYEKQHPDIELVGVYADEGLSGTSMKNRNELQRLIQDCEHGKIDRVITKSVSRFARNTHDLLQTVRLLKSLGVTVLFEEQGIDTAKLNSEMFLTFPGMIAQQESESISGNMRWSYKKRMESGEFNTCSPAYGFDLIDGKLVVNQSEAAVIRRIFDMYLQGIGKERIADILNEEGVPKKRDTKRWNQRMISYILINERYMGDALLQKFYTTDTLPYKKRPNKGEKTKYYVEDAGPAIVSKEVFEAAKALSQKRACLTEHHANHTLTQMCFCQKCGRAFRRLTVRGKQYWISSITEQSDCDCKKHRLSEPGVFSAFTLMMYKLKDNRKNLIGNLIYQLEKMEAMNGNSESISAIDEEIAQLCVQKHVITKLHNSGILTATDYAGQASSIENQISELRAQRRKTLSENPDDEMLDELKSLYRCLDECELSAEIDKVLFEQVIKRITVIDNSTIRFRLLGDIEFEETINEKARCKSREDKSNTLRI